MSTVTDILVVNKSVLIVEGLHSIIEHIGYRIELFVSDKHQEIISKIQKIRPKLLIIDPSLFVQIESEITGFCKKNSITSIGIVDQLIDAKILKRMADNIYLTDDKDQIAAIIKKHFDSSYESTVKTSHSLSKREIEVLQCIAKGYSAKEIADQLFLSPHTINNHKKNIIRKLGIRTTSGLTLYAVMNQLITVESN